MDEMDVLIIEYLQLNGRMTLSALSSLLNLSRTSLTERIRRVQDKGILDGFTARVPPAKVGRPILVWIQVYGVPGSIGRFADCILQGEHCGCVIDTHFAPYNPAAATGLIP